MQKLLSRCGLVWLLLAGLGFGLGMLDVGLGCGFVAYLHLRVAVYMAHMGMS